jgi:hypothetical protein
MSGGGSKIIEMARQKLHNDPAADRIWRRCRYDANLRWLLEGVLSSQKPELGRALLLSPVEFFGEIQKPTLVNWSDAPSSGSSFCGPSLRLGSIDPIRGLKTKPVAPTGWTS